MRLLSLFFQLRLHRKLGYANLIATCYTKSESNKIIFKEKILLSWILKPIQPYVQLIFVQFSPIELIPRGFSTVRDGTKSVSRYNTVFSGEPLNLFRCHHASYPLMSACHQKHNHLLIDHFPLLVLLCAINQYHRINQQILSILVTCSDYKSDVVVPLCYQLLLITQCQNPIQFGV